MQIQNITWQDTIAIRHRVLWPGESPAFCQVEGDETAWHFGVFLNGELVSVASVFSDGDGARLRKFATLTECQGKGIGSALLRHVLTVVQEAGFTHFWCDARESASGFYQKFGLRTEGCVFYKGDVPYSRMGVALLPNAVSPHSKLLGVPGNSQ